MSRVQRTHPVIISTETAGGHVLRFLTRSAVTIIALCVTLIVMNGQVIGINAPIEIAWVVAAAVGTGAAMFVIPFCELRFVPRGSWRVSQCSVAYEPYQGRGRRIVFEELEAIRLSAMRIELFDGEQTLWIGSPTISARAWHRLRQAVLRQLASHFVLPDGSLRAYGWRDRFASPRGRAVLALSGLSIMWIVVTWLALVMQIGWPAVGLAMLMFSRVLVDTLLRRTSVLRRMQQSTRGSGVASHDSAGNPSDDPQAARRTHAA